MEPFDASQVSGNLFQNGPPTPVPFALHNRHYIRDTCVMAGVTTAQCLAPQNNPSGEGHTPRGSHSVPQEDSLAEIKAPTAE